jgi:hypothetical protein
MRCELFCTDSRALWAQALPMSDGVSDRKPIFRLMLRSRGAGRYGYILHRDDDSVWSQPSLETFASMPEAEEAGRRALETANRQT